jgi:serine/threonine protein phosphatase PrpC
MTEVDSSNLTPPPQTRSNSGGSNVSSRSVVGSAAPVDLTGTTPLGWASRKKKGRPSSPIRELLYAQGDNSILPQRVYSERSGKTPIRRAHHQRSLIHRNNPITCNDEMQLPLPSPLSLQADHIVFAHSEAQGWRPEMEDAMISCCPLSSNELQTTWLFGVFDGHGGDFSSKFVAKHFPSVFLSSLERSGHKSEQCPWSTQELGRMLSESCQSMDALLSEEERMKVSAKCSGKDLERKVELNLRDTSGTTSCVCFFTLDDLFLANIGDSRAVLARESDSLCRSPIAIALSTDQKLSLVEERTRASAAGCL